MRRFMWLLMIGFLALFLARQARAQPTAATQSQITNLTTQIEQAMGRVRLIVNQPVTGYARRPGMKVSVSSLGWYHDGATKPDFSNVDVRTTQERVYDSKDYVTSDLKPNIVYVGNQLEFNRMTKYFYTDRTVPKKKLTEAEMLEINSLYRVIGHCEEQLAALKNLVPDTKLAAESTMEPETTTTLTPAPIPQTRWMIYGGVAVALALHIAIRRYSR